MKKEAPLARQIHAQAEKMGFARWGDIQEMLGISKPTMTQRIHQDTWTTTELMILYKKLAWTPEEWANAWKGRK